jgi:hypothetical protein
MKYSLFLLLFCFCKVDAQIRSSLSQFVGFRNAGINHQASQHLNFMEYIKTSESHTYIGIRGSLVIQNRSHIDAEFSAYDDSHPRNFGIELTHFFKPSIGGLIGIDKFDLLYDYPYNLNYMIESPGFYPSSQTTNSLKGHYITFTNLYVGGVYRFDYKGFEAKAELKAGLLNPNGIKPSRQMYSKLNSFERKAVDIDLSEAYPFSLNGQLSLAYYLFEKIGLGLQGRYALSHSKVALDYTRTIYHWTQQNSTHEDIKASTSKFLVSTLDFGIIYRFRK